MGGGLHLSLVLTTVAVACLLSLATADKLQEEEDALQSLGILIVTTLRPTYQRS